MPSVYFAKQTIGFFFLSLFLLNIERREKKRDRMKEEEMKQIKRQTCHSLKILIS